VKLYHYTCRDMAARIDRDGYLRPRPQLYVPADLLWLTDLPEPFREALGLTSLLLGCDRCEVRYEVDTDAATPWLDWYRTLPGQAARHDAQALNNTSGALPRHWWVTTQPVPVTARTDTEGGH
jgi:hypothetical protein